MTVMTMNDHIERTLAALSRSRFRSQFRLTEKDRGYVREKGFETIREHAIGFVTARIAPAFPESDGKQTPMKNHPVFIAQHATATCCRGCISKWHGIPGGRLLASGEIGFIVELIMKWIEKQMEQS